MIKLIDDDKTLIMAIDAERQHFLNLLIPTSFADNLYQFLLGGERSAHRWLETVNCRTVEFPLGSLDSINSQTELERCEAKSDPPPLEFRKKWASSKNPGYCGHPPGLT